MRGAARRRVRRPRAGTCADAVLCTTRRGVVWGRLGCQCRAFEWHGADIPPSRPRARPTHAPAFAARVLHHPRVFHHPRMLAVLAVLAGNTRNTHYARVLTAGYHVGNVLPNAQVRDQHAQGDGSNLEERAVRATPASP